MSLCVGAGKVIGFKILREEIWPSHIFGTAEPFPTECSLLAHYCCYCDSNNGLKNGVVLSEGFAHTGSGDSSAVDRQTQDGKVLGSSPGRSGGIIFFVVMNFLC